MLGLLVGSTAGMAGPYFTMGKRLAETAVKNAWREVGAHCYEADRLMGIVTRATDKAKRILRRFHGRSALDFGNGYIAGLNHGFGRIADQCGDECSQVGAVAGELSADFYCELANVVGSAPDWTGESDIPNIICGITYNMSCEGSFGRIARQECPAYAQGPSFDEYYQATYDGCCSYICPYSDRKQCY